MTTEPKLPPMPSSDVPDDGYSFWSPESGESSEDLFNRDQLRAYGLQCFEAGRQQGMASQQAKIDALMLEYCPDEMPPEQVEEWARHQKVSDVVVPIKAREVTDAEIDALCKDFERLTDAFARVKHNAEHAGDDLARTLRSIVFIADAAIALANGRG